MVSQRDSVMVVMIVVSPETAGFVEEEHETLVVSLSC
jgi:hypothetical protein